MPTASDTLALTTLPDPVTVSISTEGETYLDGQPIELSTLQSRLVAMRENFPGLNVLVRGDGSTTYQHVMDVLAVCRRAGVASLSLANRPTADE